MVAGPEPSSSTQSRPEEPAPTKPRVQLAEALDAADSASRAQKRALSSGTGVGPYDFSLGRRDKCYPAMVYYTHTPPDRTKLCSRSNRSGGFPAWSGSEEPLRSPAVRNRSSSCQLSTHSACQNADAPRVAHDNIAFSNLFDLHALGCVRIKGATLPCGSSLRYATCRPSSSRQS